MAEPIISVRDLKKIYHVGESEVHALDGVSFDLYPGRLIPTMNAEENVALPLLFRGVGKEERQKTARMYMERIGILDQALHMPGQMSGGQQQRVGIARALASRPELIFADEPTGNLDSRTSAEVLALLKDIVREQKVTLVMVTHDNSIADRADQQIRIVDGKIVERKG